MHPSADSKPHEMDIRVDIRVDMRASVSLLCVCLPLSISVKERKEEGRGGAPLSGNHSRELWTLPLHFPYAFLLKPIRKSIDCTMK